MKRTTAITILAIEISIFLAGFIGRTTCDLVMEYSLIPVSTSAANMAYIISTFVMIYAAFSIVIFLMAGVFIYHCDQRRRSWIKLIAKPDIDI